MTLGILDTPLDAALTWPEPRATVAPFALGEAVYPGSRAAARRLVEPGALAVTTGQQPGLFTGPLYTVHKALSARALAVVLERRWRRPVVPVFWVAGDDHDYAEGSRAAWLSTAGELVSVDLPPRAAGAPLTPMYREPVPPEAADLLARLEDTTPPGDARDEVLAWLRRHYRPGVSLAAAFGEALAELLAPLGVVCLDGASPALKRRAWPLLRSALAAREELDTLLGARAGELVRRGADPGVKVGDGATLVMLEAAAGRDRLLPDGAGYVTRRSGERFTAADLERIAEQEPERLSANVLLRPVVESTVLPTAAYLAGPGELRYLQLAQALYPPLGAHPQRPVPRWSGVLVEPRVTRTLDKLGLTLEEVLREGPSVHLRLARDAVPPAFESAAGALRAGIESGYQRLVDEIAGIDPTLERPARSAMGHALGGVGELEKRVLQAVRRKQTEVQGQVDRVLAALTPGGEPQERVLGLPGFAARYGLELVTELAAHVDRWYAGALEAPPPSP